MQLEHVRIDKVVLKADSGTLNVSACATRFLDYGAYCRAKQVIARQCATDRVSICVQNQFDSAEQVAAFCIGFACAHAPAVGKILQAGQWKVVQGREEIQLSLADEQSTAIVRALPLIGEMNRALQEAQSAWTVALCNEQTAQAPLQLLDVVAADARMEDRQEDVLADTWPTDAQWEAPPQMDELPHVDAVPAAPPEPEAVPHVESTKPETEKKKKPAAKRTAARKRGKRNAWFEGVKHKVVLGDLFTAKEVADIGSLSIESGRVNIIGIPMKPEFRPTRTKERSICTLYVTDHYGTITVKWMMDTKIAEKAVHLLSRGGKVGVKGAVEYDARFTKENFIWATDITWYDVPPRSDDAPEKRVELHAHTKMSGQDGVANAKDLVMTAARFGHPAIAITDHGVVQAFPDAYGGVAAAEKAGHPIKLIYGVEAYLVDDTPYEGPDGPIDEIVVFDIETTGLDKREDTLIEIGAVRLKNGEAVDTFSTFVDPQRPIPPHIVELTHITDGMVAGAPLLEEALRAFAEFVGDAPLCAHNARFDVSFLRNLGEPLGLPFANGVLDSLTLARMLLPHNGRHGLDALCKHFGISLMNHHRAVDDAEATAKVLLALLALAPQSHTLCGLNGIGSTRMLPNYHVILLATGKPGLKNIYRIVTESHLKHFYRRPVIPKSKLAQWRDGILVGSACEQGEVFRAILRKDDWQHVCALGAFYDYLEIQPLQNNAFLIRDEREAPHIRTMDDVQELNMEIVRLADFLQKPVVATCDVHFIEPEDEYYRRILMTGQGFTDMDQQPPLYLRTTEEMLQEFAYLGEARAREVVIENPVKIAEQVESGFGPYPDESFFPREENGDVLIRQIATDGAKAIYGDPLPPMIEQRLEKELGSIIKHGFETLYLAAYRLVKASMEDGYTVGSRGSVGSSFVALAMGISEVNPLAPHYHCPQCKYSDFDVADTGAGCGPDLPERQCPHCHIPMIKDGYEIPFEVFLGFHGDKVPDIDLNFSGEYQNRAFACVERMFGPDNVFRAGTVIGIAEKTAYGYVLKYMEEKQEHASRAQMELLAAGITGVKRTTGQHPGGLVVLPKGLDIFDFTPLQRPADKTDSETVTTHFDFNSLHDRLVKLDILGHDNPTMMRRLLEFTGIDPMTVPLDDPDTLSLFVSCKALGLEEETYGYKTGVLGMPEFGTPFVMGMLEETKPTTVAELLRISGLSHGTDVWLGNAQDLIRNGIAKLNECICTRDDIMNYLLAKGVEPKIAFNTMESVRKGKGLTDEMEQAMLQNQVPAWFIDSCKKIKYMFPKAHAAAYVVSALRIGYYKTHYPLAYYAAYFSVRADEIDAIKVLQGVEKVEAYIEEIDQKTAPSARDAKERNHLDLAREMLLRGFHFLPPDLEKSHVRHFLIEDGALRMPLMSVAGLGESAAISVVEARKESPLKTVEDIRERTKLNNSIIEKLREAGALKQIPESAQISLFNLME